MADTTLPGLLSTGDHASRPAASAVGTGALYSCTDHGLVYQTDGSSWTTWASLGGGTVADEGTPLSTTATTLDFVGAGVTATGTGATKTITIPGGSGIVVKDEGSTLTTDATTLDFVGAGVTASGTGATKTITIAGGGGGYPLDQYSLDGTYGDHFTAASLNTSLWTRRTYTSSEEEAQVGYSQTYMRFKCAGRGAGQGYLQTAPSGDWTFAMKWIMRFPYSNPMNWGLGVVDSSGSGLCLFYYNSGPTAPILGQVTTYTSYGGSYVQPGGAGSGPNISLTNAMIFGERPIWYQLRKSGTSYYAAWSMDGEVWCPESAAITWSGTVDRVGMFHGPIGSVSSGNGIGPFAEVDWFNKIA